MRKIKNTIKAIVKTIIAIKNFVWVAPSQKQLLLILVCLLGMNILKHQALLEIGHVTGLIVPVEAQIKLEKAPLSDLTPIYEYNDLVPEKAIIDELYSLAEKFDLDGNNWEKLVRCEATCVEDYCVKGELNNLATNPRSTAVGVGQYLIATWNATESWKQYKRARTDYKASLWEMGLDLANGEQDKWIECLEITGIYKFKK